MKGATFLPGVGVLALLAACQSAPPLDLPSEYEFDPGDPDAPTLSLEEISSGLEGALDQIFLLDPEDLYAGYETARALDDDDPAVEEACPEYNLGELGNGIAIWSGDCTALSGAFFEGNLTSFQFAPGAFIDDDGNIYEDHARLEGNGRIFEVGGGRFDMFGRAEYEVFSPPSSTDVFTEFDFDGGVFWDGVGSNGSWLQSQIAADFKLETADEDSIGVKTLSLDGRLSNLPGLFGSVVFNRIRSIRSTDGATCDLEPRNSILLRDDAGHWYQVDFQGPSGPGDFSDNCDGCGDVSLNGVSLGVICPDFSRLLSWEGLPW